MVKKITQFLLILLVITMLIVPASAEETINDLKKIYNNLQTHLYIPYYKDSEKYPAYARVMGEIKTLLNSDAITQAEISKYYNELRTVYSDLMRDTYDYSSLEILVKSFEALDPSVFTPESWKKLLSVHDSVQKELSSPTLFSRRDDITAQQYADYMQKHIQTFVGDFASAFNELELLEKPEFMTSDYLKGFKAYVDFCSREALLGSTKSWAPLQNALQIAEDTLLDNNASQTQLETAYLNLTTAYSSACSEAYSFFGSKEFIKEFEGLSSENYSKHSWERFQGEINKIKQEIEQTPFFFIPYGAGEESCKSFLEDYQKNFTKDYDQFQNILIPIEIYNELTALCENYKNLSVMDGLAVKQNYLNSALKNGETVLENKLSSLKDFEDAIKEIKEAKEDLDLAEKFLKEEQSKAKKQDAPTARLTLILTICVLILSFGAAILFSRHYFGKVNWKR